MLKLLHWFFIDQVTEPITTVSAQQTSRSDKMTNHSAENDWNQLQSEVQCGISLAVNTVKCKLTNISIITGPNI